MIGLFSNETDPLINYVKSKAKGPTKLRLNFQINNQIYGVWRKLPSYTVCVFLGYCAEQFTKLVREKGWHIVAGEVKGVYYVVADHNKPYPIQARALMFRRTKDFGPAEDPAIDWLISNVMELDRIRIAGSIPELSVETVMIGGRKIELQKSDGAAAFLAAYLTPEELLTKKGPT